MAGDEELETAWLAWFRWAVANSAVWLPSAEGNCARSRRALLTHVEGSADGTDVPRVLLNAGRAA